MPYKNPEDAKAYIKRYRAAHAEHYRELNSAWRAANPEKVAAMEKRARVKNKDKMRAATATWKANNLEKARAAYRVASARRRLEKREEIVAGKKKYAQENKGAINAAVARRKTAKLQRTPKWLDAFDFECIQSTYVLAALLTEHTGEVWHVDHVIPLQGAKVSGLHTPANLRAVRGVENLKKHNSFMVA